MILRAADRHRSEQAGIVSWHCFSAGAYYDPANVSFGDLVAVDEHVVQPGHGFDWHAHRGVTIASWVLAGALRHQDDGGVDEVIEPGRLFVQDASGGLRHRETCASTTPLRLVQQTALSGRFAVWRSTDTTDSATHLFVASGEWTVGDVVLHEGDSLRSQRRLEAIGTGDLLVWTT